MFHGLLLFIIAGNKPKTPVPLAFSSGQAASIQALTINQFVVAIENTRKPILASPPATNIPTLQSKIMNPKGVIKAVEQKG